MIALVTRFLGLFQNTAARGFEDSVAHSLMESAEAHSGRDARQLRQAACAYLRVVR